MASVSNDLNEIAASGYKKMGVTADKYLKGGNVRNIYDFLGIVPKFNDNGERQQTPYEILGVLPNIEGATEKPIVFFVRNKIKNLKPVKTSNHLDLSFSKEKNLKKTDELILFAIKCYKIAISQNNQSEADRYFELLDSLTGGKAKHYISSGYDYTKFYRRMKKQLIIDLFSHYFLLYIMQKKSIVKAGLVIKNKKFHPFEFKQQTNSLNSDDMPQIKSIRIDNIGSETLQTNDFIEEDLSQKIMPEVKNKEQLSAEIKDNISKQQNSPEKKSFIKKIIKRLKRKDKKKFDRQISVSIPKEIEPSIEKEVSYE